MKIVKARRLDREVGQLSRGAWDRVLLDRKENGFAAYVLRIHNRLYVDVDGAISWLETHREGGRRG
jgi:hypothetical protein